MLKRPALDRIRLLVNTVIEPVEPLAMSRKDGIVLPVPLELVSRKRERVLNWSLPTMESNHVEMTAEITVHIISLVQHNNCSNLLSLYRPEIATSSTPELPGPPGLDIVLSSTGFFGCVYSHQLRLKGLTSVGIGVVERNFE